MLKILTFSGYIDLRGRRAYCFNLYALKTIQEGLNATFS